MIAPGNSRQVFRGSTAFARAAHRQPVRGRGLMRVLHDVYASPLASTAPRLPCDAARLPDAPGDRRPVRAFRIVSGTRPRPPTRSARSAAAARVGTQQGCGSTGYASTRSTSPSRRLLVTNPGAPRGTPRVASRFRRGRVVEPFGGGWSRRLPFGHRRAVGDRPAAGLAAQAFALADGPHGARESRCGPSGALRSAGQDARRRSCGSAGPASGLGGRSSGWRWNTGAARKPGTAQPSEPTLAGGARHPRRPRWRGGA